MGWWSDLFSKKGDWVETEYHPEFKSNKVNDNISEPVWAIVKAMKERPSSFKAKIINGLISPSRLTQYLIRDVKTKEIMRVVRYSYLYRLNLDSPGADYELLWTWLTEKEKSLLIRTFLNIQEVKLKRSKRISNIKKENNGLKERNRLKEVYL